MCVFPKFGDEAFHVQPCIRVKTVRDGSMSIPTMALFSAKTGHKNHCKNRCSDRHDQHSCVVSYNSLIIESKAGQKEYEQIS